MPTNGKAYDPQFRERILELVRNGQSVKKLAREYRVHHQTIYGWKKQAGIDAGESPGLTTDEKKELSRLRRENEILREERDILKKAAAWFAQEAVPTPKKRSDS
jgi:transposase-like protein